MLDATQDLNPNLRGEIKGQGYKSFKIIELKLYCLQIGCRKVDGVEIVKRRCWLRVGDSRAHRVHGDEYSIAVLVPNHTDST